jgi:hypothetical protein
LVAEYSADHYSAEYSANRIVCRSLLNAAFNTVRREDLLPKMLAMGIGGKALKWFRCYLTNSKQRVV